MPSHRAQVLLSLLASTLRGWRGTQIFAGSDKPRDSPTLYDRENDADCRLVRELITELDFDVLIKPCPLGGSRFASDLDATERLPVLLDPNTGKRCSGVREVCAHLLGHYASRSWIAKLLASAPMRLSSSLASLSRGTAGANARPSRAASEPMELYSFESSPFSRLVRERLCELELAYMLRSFGKQQVADYGPPKFRATLKPYQPIPGSRRESLLKNTGKVQVPYLIDPNTGVEMFESAKILRYLDATYGLG